MKKTMHTINEVSNLISEGKTLLLAGEEHLLEKLPSGKWIGGSIPYFMTEQGGLQSKDQIMVTELPEATIKETSFKSYDFANIKNIYKDGYDNGFTAVIIPANSQTHLSFAINAPDYKEFATKPLIGWISGVHLEQLGKELPKTFIESGASKSQTNAVAIHVKLPDDKFAEIDIINLFEQGEGDVIEFTQSGFQANEAIINGVKQNFAEYLENNKADVRLPLVADYNGMMVNISFQEIKKDQGIVNFYAPVFKGIQYKHAASINEYTHEFNKHLPSDGINQKHFSCNCILNYLYSDLEGKKTGDLTGPITFGEIAYQLLNQTLVNLEIKDQK